MVKTITVFYCVQSDNKVTLSIHVKNLVKFFEDTSAAIYPTLILKFKTIYQLKIIWHITGL